VGNAKKLIATTTKISQDRSKQKREIALENCNGMSNILQFGKCVVSGVPA
jgi:hypothetical protein